MEINSIKELQALIDAMISCTTEGVRVPSSPHYPARTLATIARERVTDTYNTLCNG